MTRARFRSSSVADECAGSPKGPDTNLHSCSTVRFASSGGRRPGTVLQLDVPRCAARRATRHYQPGHPTHFTTSGVRGASRSGYVARSESPPRGRGARPRHSPRCKRPTSPPDPSSGRAGLDPDRRSIELRTLSESHHSAELQRRHPCEDAPMIPVEDGRVRESFAARREVLSRLGRCHTVSRRAFASHIVPAHVRAPMNWREVDPSGPTMTIARSTDHVTG